MACGSKKKTDKGDPRSSQGLKKETAGKQEETCMRCGGPLEREGDMLCKKCEAVVH